MNRTPNVDLMNVDPAILRGYFHKKECQDGCGVYCVVSESLASSQRLRYLTEKTVGDLQVKKARLLRAWS